MAKKKSQSKVPEKSSIKGKMIGIGIIAAIVVGVTYFVIMSAIPVNVNYPVFAASENISIKAVQAADGSYLFADQSTKGGKMVPGRGTQDKTYVVSLGNLVSIHLINEVKNQPNEPSKHNINIDAFNVHSNDLGYFQTQSITFLANEQGEFKYYCTIHPEMHGVIVVK